MKFPINFPALTCDGEIPFWTGNGYALGNKQLSVLEYSFNDQGWNDDLTSFHEENASDSHAIDVASKEHALAQIKQFMPKQQPIILEVGCSSGYMLKAISQAFPQASLVGSDVVRQPLYSLAKELPNIPLMRFDLTTCPLPDNSVDVVVILNVLEHIEKDDLALQQIHRILKPQGIAIIEVPAGPHLYDIYDKFLKHFRRYTLKQLTTTIKKQNFSILKQSHLGYFIYPAFKFVKRKNQQKNISEDKQPEIVAKQIANSKESVLLKWAFALEKHLGNYISYPCGIRCLVTCRKI